ncbi:MAG: hypothetical protein KatS3mg076_0276 [Candidatus Binatia bacterium]|nr:MAG: hypothetical protein KatS3mg076_0276 [Candidatus Binatia bacterium]
MRAEVAGLPARERDVRIEGSVFRMVVPDAWEKTLCRETLVAGEDPNEPPYWVHLWPGEKVLARRLLACGGWPGERVLELGCGLGLAGLVAARLGSRVTLVDRVHEALAFARESARSIGVRPCFVRSDLGRLGLRGGFRGVLAAEVAYGPAEARALAENLARLLAPGGTGLCADSVRVHDPDFERRCSELGLETSREWVREEDDDGRPVWVRLVEVGRP